MSAKRERRYITTTKGLRLVRASEGSAPKITGYAAVFDEISDDLGWFKEKIAPGAFSRTIEEDDIRALWNHDSNYVLGRNVAGTLELSEDEHGLKITNAPPDTQWARDLLTTIERGDVTQMSFGFLVRSETWEVLPDRSNLRTLNDVQLFDVSPVTFPAYPQTDVSVRGLTLAGAPLDPLFAVLLRQQRGIALDAEDRALLRSTAEQLASVCVSAEERARLRAQRVRLAELEL